MTSELSTRRIAASLVLAAGLIVTGRSAAMADETVVEKRVVEEQRTIRDSDHRAPCVGRSRTTARHAAHRSPRHATVARAPARRPRHTMVDTDARVERSEPIVEERTIVHEAPHVIERTTRLETVPAAPIIEERTETIEEE